MVLFYFSGTGNSKYIAELFSQKMEGKCYSIEEAIDFSQLIKSEEVVGFCYPVYGSRVPRNMREFVQKFLADLKGKKLIIFATQWYFSGDGARVLTDLFPKNHVEVIYAEHFNMPNNISNSFWFRQVSEQKMEKKIFKAEKKLDTAIQNIKLGRVKQRGFSGFAKCLGELQGKFWQKESTSVGLVAGSMEDKIAKSIQINQDCTSCRICVKVCPVNNLKLENKVIEHNNDCIGCYRCVNKCPERAIALISKATPKWQYKCIKNATELL